jgi:hypothetical protein
MFAVLNPDELIVLFVMLVVISVFVSLVWPGGPRVGGGL